MTSDNFVIIDTAGRDNGKPEVIGEVDFSSALTTVHPKAIYIHQGQQYHVEHLDFDKRKAYVKPVNVDYFTDAIRYTQVRVLEVAEEETIAGPAARAHGDVLVRSQVVGFKKIKFFTNENVGSGKLELPENEMHTTSFWMTLGHGLLAELPFSLSERQSGIFGLLYALGSMATLLMMCDRRDLGTAVGERPPARRARSTGKILQYRRTHREAREFFEPNLYIYDAYPGGIGISEPLYRICDALLSRTLELISACPCENGCPSCVGPTADRSERTKEVALEILRRVCGDMNGSKAGTEPHELRYVALTASAAESPAALLHDRNCRADDGESPAPRKRPAMIRNGCPRFSEPLRRRINTETIFPCAAGALPSAIFARSLCP